MSPVDLVRESVLFELLRNLGGERAALLRLVDDFVSLWAERMRRLAWALHAGDTADARAVLRSIGTTSSMLGAQELAGEVQRVLTQVDAGRHTDLGPIRCIGERTCDRLLELAV